MWKLRTLGKRLPNAIWNLSTRTKQTELKKRHWSPRRTDQSRSYINKSVQLLADTKLIQTCQTVPLSILETVDKRPTKMLIGSGASLTLINSGLFHQLPYNIRQSARHLSSKFQIHLADKSCLQVQKTLLLPITIANCTRKHIVYVVPRLWRPCIIGTLFIYLTFMKRLGFFMFTNNIHFINVEGRMK